MFYVDRSGYLADAIFTPGMGAWAAGALLARRLVLFQGDTDYIAYVSYNGSWAGAKADEDVWVRFAQDSLKWLASGRRVG